MLHPESDSAESFFRNTFDYVAVGIAQVSPQGKFLRINRHFCEIIGYSAGEMIGNTFQSITHPDDLQKDMDQVQQLLEGKMNT
ncbi:MAG: PAS domain S-box protein, partial [Bacteroides sp.]|nr:PAS domain S-box protein [Bacteroides sp.]